MGRWADAIKYFDKELAVDKQLGLTQEIGLAASILGGGDMK
jgi:hypothetical protein